MVPLNFWKIGENMTISAVGFISVMMCIYIIIRDLGHFDVLVRKTLELCIITGIFFDIGYVLKIGDFECEYNYLFTGVAFASALLSKQLRRMKKRELVLFVLLIYLFLVVVVMEALEVNFLSCSYSGVTWDQSLRMKSLNTVNASIKQIIFPIIRLFMMGILLITFCRMYDEKLINKFCNKIYKVSKIYAVFILIEILWSNLFGSELRNLIYIVFGKSGSTTLEYRNFFGINAPLGLAREPSNFALSCFIISLILYYIYRTKNERKCKYIMIFYLVLLVASGSVSGFLYLLAFAFLFLCSCSFNARKNIYYVLPILGFAAIFAVKQMYAYRIELLINEFSGFSKGIENLTYNSTINRMYSIYNNIMCFFKVPVFGTGLGTVYSFSCIVTLITNLGIIGTIVFGIFYLGNIIKKFGNKKTGVLVCIFLVIAFSCTGHMGYILYYSHLFYVTVIGNLLLKKGEYKK